MHYYFITGSSRGIGKSLAEELLKNSNAFVFGLSRTNTIQHPRFKFIALDLLDNTQLDNFQFPDIKEIDSVNLINNAGLIGEIAPVGDKGNTSIRNTFLVNTIAPAILSNQFIKQFSDLSVLKLILNISSGAGRHTVEAWADYCASKSALDMYSQVIFDEQKQKVNPVRIVSIAPGVVDTSMQIEIRNSDRSKFSDYQYFVDLKNNNKLDTPDFVAEKIVRVLPKILQQELCVTDIRQF